MVPFWKVKREILRFGQQVWGAVTFVQAYYRRWVYDRTERASVKVTAGEQEPRPNMAVLLIYQPNALLESLFLELEHLRAHGLSIILVANHPLSDDATTRLKPYCHLLIERPNVGYDFGGYREAMLAIFERNMTPENLFVLNDSAWFPLNHECTLLETALAAPTDAFGIFQNTKSKKAAHHHLQSYFYRFKGALVTDPEFQKFWTGMPFFTAKRQVVRRLEVRLTGYINKLGYSISSLVTPEDVRDAGLALSDAELQDVAQFHSESSERGREIFKKLVTLKPGDPEWAGERLRVLNESRFKYYYIDGHPLVLFKYLNTPFLKKSRESWFVDQRRVVISAGYDRGFDPVVRQEVMAWDHAEKSVQLKRPLEK